MKSFLECKLTDLSIQLNSWAHNEEMVDGHWTEHGQHCIEAARFLTKFRGILHEIQEILWKLEKGAE